MVKANSPHLKDADFGQVFVAGQVAGTRCPEYQREQAAERERGSKE